MIQPNSWTNWLYQGAQAAGHRLASAAYHITVGAGSRVTSAATSALSSVAQSAASTFAPVTTKIVTNITAVYDTTNAVQGISVDQRVKDRYDHVLPTVVKPFYDRFHTETMISLNLITTALQEKCKREIPLISRAVGSYEKYVRVAFQTASLNVVTWLADKVKKVMPDNDKAKRTEFAAKVTGDLQNITGTFKTITDSIGAGLDWRDLDFKARYQKKLSESPLHQATKNKYEFYERLAIRLLARIEKDLPGKVNPHIGEILKTLSKEFSHSTKKQKLTEFLLEIDTLLTDRTQIKEWLIQILKISNDGMDSTYDAFLDTVNTASWWIPFRDFFSDQTNPTEVSSLTTGHGKDYGKVIMDFLMMLEPRTFGGSTLSLYKYLVGAESIANGTDFFSRLLKDSTGTAIEQLMASSTDSWVKGIFKLVRANLFDEQGGFIERPSYISEKEWTDLDPSQKLQACTKDSELYTKYKNQHIQQVDGKLLDTTQKLGRNIFRAGIILEQFSTKAGTTLRDERKHWFTRSVAATWILFTQAPIINLILNCFHRLSIIIRDAISYRAGKSTAASLSKNLDKFLETESIEFLVRTMLEKMLTDLDLLDDPQARDEVAAAQVVQHSVCKLAY